MESTQLKALMAALGDGSDPEGSPERAGLAYRKLHERLVRLFRLNNASDPEALADEALNRLARRAASPASAAGGTSELSSPEAFALGIARHLLQEDARRQRRDEEAAEAWASTPRGPEDRQERRLDALDHCLERMRPEQRDLLRSYYQWTGREKIEHHRELAERLGLNLNAMRNRLMRARAELERCLHHDLSDVSAGIDTPSRRRD